MSRSLSYAPGALRPLRVSVNASASLVGNVVYSACQAGLLIVLARLGSAAMVGQYALGLAISGPVMLLASLQLRSVQATDAANNNHFSEYLALRLTTTVLALVAIAIIGGVATRSVAAASVILLVGALKNADALSDVYRGLMQQAERMERVAVSMVLRGIVSLGPFALALALGASLPAALTIAIGAGLLVWATWDVHSARILLRESADDSRALRRWLGAVPRFERERLIGLARTALPLGFVAMLLSLNSYAPQYAVKHLGTDAELGVFAALLYVASAPRVLIGAAGQSASPRLAKLYESGNVRAFRALHTRLLRFGVGVGVVSLVGVTLLGKPLLHLVFGAEYATHVRLLIELSAVSCVNHIVSLQGYTVTAARCFRAQFPVSLLVALSTILSAYALVPRHGASGAAVAILIGLLVQGAGYSVLLRAAVRRLEQGIRTGEQHALA